MFLPCKHQRSATAGLQSKPYVVGSLLAPHCAVLNSRVLPRRPIPKCGMIQSPFDERAPSQRPLGVQLNGLSTRAVDSTFLRELPSVIIMRRGWWAWGSGVQPMRNNATTSSIISARLAPSSRPLPLLFVVLLFLCVFPLPSPPWVINVIIIIVSTHPACARIPINRHGNGTVTMLECRFK